MFFDTHCHLNFHAFEGGTDKILARASAAKVTEILIPGTDLETSQKAIHIAQQFSGCYAAVGIHPHHISTYMNKSEALEQDILSIEKLLTQNRVVAVGEIGLDRHVYRISKHGPDITVTPEYFALQLQALSSQVQLAIRHDKSVVIHNRESADDLLQFFKNLPQTDQKALQNRTVLHCCESDQRLLDLAIRHSFFIGVDGDVTFDDKKQDFIRQVPLSRLVLETDAPYILPEPIRSEKRQPNHPAFIPLIAAKVAEILEVSLDEVAKQTTANAHTLYGLPQQES